MARAVAVTTAVLAGSGTLAAGPPPASAAPAIVNGPTVVWPGPRQVALTFDDGPAPATPGVLDVLARYGVRATFFVIGRQITGREGTLRRAAAAGHSIQDHTWDHPQLPRLSNGAVASQLTSTADRITTVTGARPTCFRPPGGAPSPRVEAVGASLGLRQILWTTDSGDWRGTGAGGIVANALGGANGSGRVVVFHDGGGKTRAPTVAALASVIEGYAARGYTFVTLCNTAATGPAQPPAPTPPPEITDCAGRDEPPASVLAAAEPGTFSPIAPVRLLDTRNGTGTTRAPVGAGCLVAVAVTGPGLADPAAGAVALSVTATGSRRPGFVTAWPCGTPRPTSSALNPAPGLDVAGLAVVRPGSGGQVCLFSSTGTDLVADLTGWFAPGAGPGFAPQTPTRILDTRTDSPAGPPRRLGAGEVRAVPVAPAGTAAAALTVTLTGPAQAAFVRVFPCGTVSATSTVNAAAGATAASGALVGLAPDGTACVQASADADLVLDLLGTFTPGAGLPFHPVEPQRRFDTRSGAGGVPAAPVGLAPLVVPVAGTGGVDPAARVVVWTLTADRAGAPGWIAATPCTPPGSTSSLNPVPGRAVAALAVTPLDAGSACVAASAPVDVVADVAGWF